MTILQPTYSAKTRLRRHTQEIRVGASGYATMADAIAYCNSLVTLSAQNRVRILVDNDTYNEAFILPQYCDIQGESKAGVIFQYNDGDNIFSDDWAILSGFLSMHTDSLLRDASIVMAETTQQSSGLVLLDGENLVTGQLNNVLIDCDQTTTALSRGEVVNGFGSTVSYYLSMSVKNCELISGGNTCVGFGNSAEAFIGSISFEDTNITGGEQMQGGAAWNDGVFYIECWAVFFGHTLAKSTHHIPPECNFEGCNVKMFNPPWTSTGVQAFNLEYSLNLGSKSSCINSNFETVRDNPADGYHGTPLFISSYAEENLIVNPDAKFSIYTDGCTFVKNSTYIPSYDIRWFGDSGATTPPTVTWGGTGTNPTIGETSGNP